MENLKLDLEIYNIWYDPFWKSKYFFLFSLIIFLLFLFFFIKFLIKKISENKKIIFRNLINELKSLQKKVNTVENEKLYLELISKIRMFIFINYKKDIFCKSEIELIDFLELQNIPDDLFIQLKEIIFRGQQVKFSRARFSKIQVEKDLSKSIELITGLNKFFCTKNNNKTT